MDDKEDEEKEAEEKEDEEKEGEGKLDSGFPSLPAASNEIIHAEFQSICRVRIESTALTAFAKGPARAPKRPQLRGPTHDCRSLTTDPVAARFLTGDEFFLWVQ
ncbi:hypothetical protein MY3296_010164 [Beauveria thailandica]